MKPRNIDEYIVEFPLQVRVLLEEVRATIHKAAPDAEEAISYQLAAFKLHGNLVYFGAFKNHLGFYPTASGIENFKHELSAYEWSKGSIKFPFDKPIPHQLITKIVKFRIKENKTKVAAKKNK